jgi:rod shape-determining protein MreC
VVVGLVVVSLVLVTVYFRESDSGAVHGLQNAGATVLHPFEVAAERVARPFRDASNYVSGLVNAKSENQRLRAEVDQLRQRASQSAIAIRENAKLKQLLAYRDGPTFPQDYRGVPATVIAPPSGPFEQEIVVAAGSNAGIRLYDPVVTADGLVGEVSKLTGSAARVTLLTDTSAAVAARDVGSNALGVVRHGDVASSSLMLDRVTKDQVVNQGDRIVTAGTKTGQLPSIYPRGIPIGTVTSVGQLDTDLYKQVEVKPYVDFSSLDSVLVLVSNKPPLRLP